MEKKAAIEKAVLALLKIEGDTTLGQMISQVESDEGPLSFQKLGHDFSTEDLVTVLVSMQKQGIICQVASGHWRRQKTDEEIARLLKNIRLTPKS